MVHASMAEDGWVCGMILSCGTHVEVLSPEEVRRTVCEPAARIHETYRKR